MVRFCNIFLGGCTQLSGADFLTAFLADGQPDGGGGRPRQARQARQQDGGLPVMCSQSIELSFCAQWSRQLASLAAEASQPVATGGAAQWLNILNHNLIRRWRKTLGRTILLSKRCRLCWGAGPTFLRSCSPQPQQLRPLIVKSFLVDINGSNVNTEYSECKI